MAEPKSQESEQRPMSSLLDEAMKTYFKTHKELIESQYRLRGSPKDLNDPLIHEITTDILQKSQIFLAVELDTAFTILALTPSTINPEELSDDPSQWSPELKGIWNKAYETSRGGGFAPHHLKEFVKSAKLWMAQKQKDLGNN